MIQVNFDETNALGVPKLTQFFSYIEVQVTGPNEHGDNHSIPTLAHHKRPKSIPATNMNFLM